MISVEVLKKIACEAIDKKSAELNALSQDIWSHPELNFQEVHAHNALTNFLEKSGFPNVERNYVVNTGFRADYGDDDKPRVAVLCEYDALPKIGHGCGHNLIAEAGTGAGIGIKAAIDAAREAGKSIGKVTVLGTPAEEGGGGKLDMIDAGAFNNVDVGMMCHPYQCGLIHRPGSLCIQRCEIKYFGKASHAAGFPWEGINALDAAVMAYTSISVMRQQCKPTWRIHGVIVNGGVKPNIIPEETKLDYYLRTPTMKELVMLKTKAKGCFEAAAMATGCRMEINWEDKVYSNVVTNPTLAKLYDANATNLGARFERDPAKIAQPSGSTDMGNVSHVVPSIHPFFYVGSNTATHSREFTVVAGGETAQPYTIVQAKAMAMTTIDIFCQPDLVQTMKEEFEQQLLEENA